VSVLFSKSIKIHIFQYLPSWSHLLLTHPCNLITINILLVIFYFLYYYYHPYNCLAAFGGFTTVGVCAIYRFLCTWHPVQRTSPSPTPPPKRGRSGACGVRALYCCKPPCPLLTRAVGWVVYAVRPHRPLLINSENSLNLHN